MKDLYKILEIISPSSQSEIKIAYRKLVLKYHPDRVSPEKKKESEELFKDISFAYSILSDKIKKYNYDKYGEIDGDSDGFSMEETLRKFTEEFGDSKEQDINRIENNFHNAVNRAKEGRPDEIICGVCRGVGTIEKEQGFFIVKKKCKNCNGRGYVYAPLYTNQNNGQPPFFKMTGY